MALTALTRLRNLDLGTGQLWGPLPEGLGAWSHLTRLVVASNVLTGTIPSSIQALTALTLVCFLSCRVQSSTANVAAPCGVTR